MTVSNGSFKERTALTGYHFEVVDELGVDAEQSRDLYELLEWCSGKHNEASMPIGTLRPQYEFQEKSHFEVINSFHEYADLTDQPENIMSRKEYTKLLLLSHQYWKRRLDPDENGNSTNSHLLNSSRNHGHNSGIFAEIEKEILGGKYVVTNSTSNFRNPDLNVASVTEEIAKVLEEAEDVGDFDYRAPRKFFSDKPLKAQRSLEQYRRRYIQRKRDARIPRSGIFPEDELVINAITLPLLYELEKLYNQIPRLLEGGELPYNIQKVAYEGLHFFADLTYNVQSDISLRLKDITSALLFPYEYRTAMEIICNYYFDDPKLMNPRVFSELLKTPPYHLRMKLDEKLRKRIQYTDPLHKYRFLSNDGSVVLRFGDKDMRIQLVGTRALPDMYKIMQLVPQKRQDHERKNNTVMISSAIDEIDERISSDKKLSTDIPLSIKSPGRDQKTRTIYTLNELLPEGKALYPLGDSYAMRFEVDIHPLNEETAIRLLPMIRDLVDQMGLELVTVTSIFDEDSAWRGVHILTKPRFENDPKVCLNVDGSDEMELSLSQDLLVEIQFTDRISLIEAVENKGLRKSGGDVLVLRFTDERNEGEALWQTFLPGDHRNGEIFYKIYYLPSSVHPEIIKRRRSVSMAILNSMFTVSEQSVTDEDLSDRTNRDRVVIESKVISGGMLRLLLEDPFTGERSYQVIRQEMIEDVLPKFNAATVRTNTPTELSEIESVKYDEDTIRNWIFRLINELNENQDLNSPSVLGLKRILLELADNNHGFLLYRIFEQYSEQEDLIFFTNILGRLRRKQSIETKFDKSDNMVYVKSPYLLESKLFLDTILLWCRFVKKDSSGNPVFDPELTRYDEDLDAIINGNEKAVVEKAAAAVYGLIPRTPMNGLNLIAVGRVARELINSKEARELLKAYPGGLVNLSISELEEREEIRNYVLLILRRFRENRDISEEDLIRKAVVLSR